MRRISSPTSLVFFVFLALLVEPRLAIAASPGVNGKIVFQSDRDGNFEIYVMNADGTGQDNLTNDPAQDTTPVWSPDGSKIAFSSNRDGNDQIYLMNADGTSPIRLTNSLATDVFPRWSPDGSKIAFASFSLTALNYDIWVMNTDGTGQTNLTNHPAADLEPVWSPDGSKIAFRTKRDGNFEIYVMNADGSAPTNVSNHPSWDESPDWSPDGLRILFASFRDGFSEIWVMNADGTDPTALTASPRGDGMPAWSPDGSRIAFVSFRDFNDEIYVMNADGTDATRLTNNAAPGSLIPYDWYPGWQPLAPTGEVPRAPAVEVSIKVRPVINLASQGVVAVAIITTDTFDATAVSPSTVCFGNDDDPSRRDCTEAHGWGHVQDVNGDGRADQVLHYEVGQIGVDSGDSSVCLTGTTFEGIDVRGCAAIRAR